MPQLTRYPFQKEVVQVAAVPAAVAWHHQHPPSRVAQPTARLVDLFRRLEHNHPLLVLIPGQGTADLGLIVVCGIFLPY